MKTCGGQRDGIHMLSAGQACCRQPVLVSYGRVHFPAYLTAILALDTHRRIVGLSIPTIADDMLSACQEPATNLPGRCAHALVVGAHD